MWAGRRRLNPRFSVRVFKRRSNIRWSYEWTKKGMKWLKYRGLSALLLSVKTPKFIEKLAEQYRVNQGGILKLKRYNYEHTAIRR